MKSNEVKILYFDLPAKNFPVSVTINGDSDYFEIKIIY